VCGFRVAWAVLSPGCRFRASEVVLDAVAALYPRFRHAPALRFPSGATPRRHVIEKN
jgi:hypothetical protein